MPRTPIILAFVPAVFAASAAQNLRCLEVHGNWCGPGARSGPVTDDLDAACRAQDLCARRAGNFATAAPRWAEIRSGGFAAICCLRGENLVFPAGNLVGCSRIRGKPGATSGRIPKPELACHFEQANT